MIGEPSSSQNILCPPAAATMFGLAQKSSPQRLFVHITSQITMCHCSILQTHTKQKLENEGAKYVRSKRHPKVPHFYQTRIETQNENYTGH